MVESNVVSRYRDAIRKIVDGLDEARNLELVISSQGGAGTMFGEEDFTDANADIDLAKLTAAIGSRGAIETLVTAGGNAHLTNLNRMLYQSTAP